MCQLVGTSGRQDVSPLESISYAAESRQNEKFNGNIHSDINMTCQGERVVSFAPSEFQRTEFGLEYRINCSPQGVVS